MRYEVKHSYFKRLAGNLINVAHTLAVRHQQLQCYHHLDSESLGGVKDQASTNQSKIYDLWIPQ
jgi:hypothetical protein